MGAMVVLMAGVIGMAGESAKVAIRSYDREDSRGSVAISVDGQEVGGLEYKGSDHWLELGPIEVPRGAKRIGAKADLRWTHYQAGPQKARGEAGWAIVDISPLMAPLREESVSFGKRLKAAIEARGPFGERYPELAEALEFTAEVGEPVSVKEIAEAERRLGFALPTEFSDLLREVGTVAFQEVSAIGPGQLDRAMVQFRRDWDYSEAQLTRLSAETRAIYGEGVLLFVEEGDGLGGLLYRPAGDGRPAQVYWVHQESFDAPELLKDRAGRPRSLVGAIRNLYARYSLPPLEDALEGQVLIDESAPAEFRLELEHDTGKRGLNLRLMVRWEEVE